MEVYLVGSGEEYTGDWCEGIRHGHGVWKCGEERDAMVYNGEFKDGAFHGYGAAPTPKWFSSPLPLP